MPSRAFLESAVAQEADEIYLVLLTITHPDLAALGLDYPELGISEGALRFVNNNTDITSRGDVFKAYGFGFTPPGQGEGERMLASLTVDNVDRRIALTLRALQGQPAVLVELVLASDPDTVEQTLPEFSFTGAEGDALEVTGQLSVDIDEDEPVTSYGFTPRTAPALF